MQHILATLSYFPAALSWKRDTHQSYFELLSSCFELKHETNCSELKHDAHRNYSKLLSGCSELKT